MGVYTSKHSDGEWGPAKPLDYAPGYDAEVSVRGEWQLYRDGDHLVAVGRHSNKFVRAWIIYMAVRRDRRNPS